MDNYRVVIVANFFIALFVDIPTYIALILLHTSPLRWFAFWCVAAISKLRRANHTERWGALARGGELEGGRAGGGTKRQEGGNDGTKQLMY